MRIPYYLAQYDQARNPVPRRSSALPVAVVGGVVVAYVGILAALLLLGGLS